MHTSDVRKTAFELFQDAETLMLRLIMPMQCNFNRDLITIAETRKDCVVFASPQRIDVAGIASAITQTNNVLDFFNAFVHLHMLYSIVDTNICMTDTMMYSDMFH